MFRRLIFLGKEKDQEVLNFNLFCNIDESLNSLEKWIVQTIGVGIFDSSIISTWDRDKLMRFISKYLVSKERLRENKNENIREL